MSEEIKETESKPQEPQNEFVHLHLHTQYSLLDGAIRIKDLVKKLQADNVKACAITDHGTMYGIINFYQALKAANIKPIIGVEAYVAPGDLHNKSTTTTGKRNHHLVLLAKDMQGVKNLYKLSSIAQLEGFYYKPRIDKELLRKYSEGIIALSACLGGEVPQLILEGQYDKARQVALDYVDIMGGVENFYLEIQSNGIEEQNVVNAELIKISQETGIGLVATNDCHYVNKDDSESHKILICIQTQSKITDENRMELHSDQLWVKSQDEMYSAFGADPITRQALENTVKIAERCNVEFKFGENHLPTFEPDPAELKKYSLDSSLEPRKLETEYMRKIASVGLEERLIELKIEDEQTKQEYRERLDLEIKVIEQKGYIGYFLIVWDFINWSRKNGIPVGPGRGSGAGSLVAYSIGITNINPLAYNLLFERFLNPERPSMPDFDIDFCVDRRNEVIQYVQKKYGNERVAQIATFSKLKARSIVRDVGRVLDIPLAVIDKLAKKIDESSLEETLKATPELENEFLAIEKGEELLRHSKKLEGLFRQSGIHAAGVIICSDAIDNYSPLARNTDKDSEFEDMAVCQFDKDIAEMNGLIKFDFLGLANLTIIQKVEDIMHKSEHLNAIKKDIKNFSIEKIPLDDTKTYELLQRGDTTGVFQLESRGMRQLLKKFKPTVFEDIIAIVALYRPGPMGSGMLDDFVDCKHGIKDVVYPFAELEPVLKDTYGVIVYQEQVMQIAQIIAGYSLGGADLLRRAMGKKKPEEMQKQKQVFLDGAKERNFDVEKAEQLFDNIAKFAEYGFNKSHSAAYALVAYQTAYLKANYYPEYMAGLISTNMSDSKKIVQIIQDTHIPTLPPDVNLSKVDFSVEYSANGLPSLRFGLAGVKGVGEDGMEHIIEERNKNGKYKDIFDLCSRNHKGVNKRSLEALIKAGAMDCFTGIHRSQMLGVLDEAIQSAGLIALEKQKAGNNMTLDDLFGGGDDDNDSSSNGTNSNDNHRYPAIEEFNNRELAKYEKEVLGFYFMHNPLKEYEPILNKIACPSSAVSQLIGKSVLLAGIVKSCKHIQTKQNKKMGILTIEDGYGELEVTIFSNLYGEVLPLLEEERTLFIEATIDGRGENGVSVKASNIYDIEGHLFNSVSGFVFESLGMPEHTTLAKLKDVLNSSKPSVGDAGKNILLQVNAYNGYDFDIVLGDNYAIEPNLNFVNMLDNLTATTGIAWDLESPFRVEVELLEKDDRPSDEEDEDLVEM